MPKCVECGTETPRDQMRGATDELRCPACAQKAYAPFVQPRRQVRAPSQPLVTAAAAVAAVVCTVIDQQSPDSIDFLIAHGPAVWDGQLWRLVTSVLPHVNYWHVAFNVYWLWLFGRDVEGWMGPLRFAGFFVVVAAGSSAAELLLSGNTGIGLSGVVYALFGLLYALRPDKDFAQIHMRPQTVQLFVVWFFVCILLTYGGVMPVANAAHGAGAVLGWLIGRAILSPRREELLAGVCGIAALLIVGSLHMPWNGRYAWHRGNKCFEAEEYRQALYWFEKAQGRLPREEASPLQPMLLWLRQQAENQDHQPGG